MGRRFSFDIGTNSIGWAVWRTGPDPKLIFGEDAPGTVDVIWFTDKHRKHPELPRQARAQRSGEPDQLAPF